MVICLERGADLHMARLKPLPLTVSCFSKIQIGFTLLVPAHLGSPGKKAVKRVCVYVSFIAERYRVAQDGVLCGRHLQRCSGSSSGGGDMGDDTSVTGRQRTLKWLDTTP